MYQNALIVITLPLTAVLVPLSSYLKTVTKNVTNRIYVHFESNYKKTSVERKLLYELVPEFYHKTASSCKHLDVRLLLPRTPKFRHELSVPLDVVHTDSLYSDNVVKSSVSNQFRQPNCPEIVSLDCCASAFNSVAMSSTKSEVYVTYDTVILGGTFDRLHNGHKVLLSEAILKTNRKLIVGVTDGEMLKRKVLWELIDPLAKRMTELNEFLDDIDPCIEYSIVPIYDTYGPSVINEDIDCLIASNETMKGGLMVNIERSKRNMKPLDLITVNLIEDPYHTEQDEVKISSSTKRRDILGTFIKSPVANLCMALTGSLMSNELQVANSLKSLDGCRIIDCREIVNWNSDVRQKFIEEFVTSESQTNNCLDMDAFDYAMTTDELKRNKINQMMYPAMKQMLKELKTQSPQISIFVLPCQSDCRLLQLFDQVWVTISPEQERLQALKTKYFQLSNEKAEQLIRNSLSNVELVNIAHVVFSTQWGSDFIEKQVEKAWNSLSAMLKNS